ncbi:MAG: hypothetical protein RL215_446, partial [Planctomycetota bacterium]
IRPDHIRLTREDENSQCRVVGRMKLRDEAKADKRDRQSG